MVVVVVVVIGGGGGVLVSSGCGSSGSCYICSGGSISCNA